ncbi:hypothetical protein MNB_SM-3-744 [hydrothermal vent metagenome]|uniref:Uncharacterized protein n=1 Tax=hydrothermal vent metagenome TaxID=652676 RepID=A0A1W1D3E0_9ZZZZ
MIQNKFYSKPFLRSLFFVQNKWHQHGVLVHTLRVVYNVIKAKDFKFFAAAWLHDIGKPFCAFVKDEEDKIYNEYSFTDHEERSYQIIKNWPFISDYTKMVVRYHYLIRDIKNSKKDNNIKRYEEKKAIWESLTPSFQEDLKTFLQYDDNAKGKKRR